jgi:hypothetical protein
MHTLLMHMHTNICSRHTHTFIVCMPAYVNIHVHARMLHTRRKAHSEA